MSGTITGQLRYDDYLSAYRLQDRRQIRFLVAALSAIAVGGAVSYLLGHHFEGTAGLLIASSGVIGLLIGRLRTLAQRRRVFEQHKALQSRITYAWDAHRLQAENTLGRSDRPWSTYHRLGEGERVFLLYHTENMFEILPKEWFADPAQQEDFRRCSGAGMAAAN